MKTVTPNAVLLKRTLAHIEAHKDEWDQDVYRCGTGMCFAGWACQLAGGRWAFPADSERPQYLHAVQGDEPEAVHFIGGHRVIRAHVRARRILGLSHTQAYCLFDEDNDLRALRRMVTDLCEATS